MTPVDPGTTPRHGRFRRFFFMHLGTLVSVLVYFDLCGRAGYSADGVRHALLVALVVASAYGALAWSRGEPKHFDLGIWTLFAFGTLATRAGVEPVLRLFQHYSPALVPLAFGLTALVPLVLGRETFTYYYARRQTPAWQQKLPTFAAINRVLTGYWVLIFLVAAGLAASAPLDWRFTLLYPNLVIFGLGLPAPLWLAPLYFRLFPPALPTAVEPLILGMPFAFDRQAAGDATATIQYRVSGAEAGDYVLRVARGKCESFAGTVPAPDLTVHTPDTVWVGVVRGELDGGRALMEGLYRVEGDVTLLAKLQEWFRAGR